jgi:lysophospholipase L1-like esterase
VTGVRPAGELPRAVSRGLGLAVSAAVFVLAAGAAELAVRALRPAWRPPPAGGVPFIRADPNLGWRLREGWRGPFVLPHRTTRVEISAQGLRDDEISPRPGPGRRRVLLLGDSFAWGFGVEREEMFDRILEERTPGLEIVNESVPGYGTDQELLLFEAQGVGFHPELVLLLFHPNDLLNNTWPRQYGDPKPVFRVEGDGLRLDNVPVPSGRLREIGAGILRRSFLLHQLWKTAVEPTQDLHASRFLAWDVTERLLLRMKATSEEHGARFAVVTFPWVDDATNRLLERVRAVLARDRIAHVDLAPALSARMQTLLDPTQHLNPEGHRAVAAALAPALSDLLAR